MSYTLIPLEKKDLWTEYVRKAVLYDFYHTWDYHAANRVEGEPFLFVYKEGNDFIALPLLKRHIPDTELWDCTSVYGYAGPIASFDFENLNNCTIENFKRSFSDFIEEEKIVSVFSRLHPIINQNVLLRHLGGLHENGKTVAIDLRNTYEEQRSKYRKSHRAKINQLKRKGFVVTEAKNREELREFVRIYNENMSRVNAVAYYYFDEKYFLNLLSAADYKSKLYMLYKDGIVAAGAIITFCNSIIQFHLSGTAAEFLREGPMKVMLDEVSQIGRESGYYYFHLGGGVGGEEDSLFDFKAGFSDLHLEFRTWRYIANESVYRTLVHKKYGDEVLDDKQFPLYR